MTATYTTITRQVNTDADMQTLGASLARIVPGGTVISLEGPLGAGKTTWVRGFLRGLGYQGKVKSPTYTLVEPYHIESYDLFHFDLYRLNSPEELHGIGIEEYFTPATVCLIEWPAKGGEYLPQSDLFVYFDILDSESDESGVLSAIRSVRLEACSLIGEEILAGL